MVKVDRVIDGNVLPAIPHEEERGVPVPHRLDVYALMDKLDEEAILAEVEGGVANTFAYEIAVGGKTVRGLGKVGVDMLVRRLANQGIVIREIESSWEDHGEYAVFRVVSQRFRVLVRETGNGVPAQVIQVPQEALTGWKRQPKVGRRSEAKGGGTYPIENWFEIGYQKAARNSKRRFLPEEQIARMIRQAVKEGRLTRVDAEGRVVREPAKPEDGIGVVETIRRDLVLLLKLCEQPITVESFGAVLSKASGGALSVVTLTNEASLQVRRKAHKMILRWIEKAAAELEPAEADRRRKATVPGEEALCRG